MSTAARTSNARAVHQVSLDALLTRLLSDHPPTILAGDAAGMLNREITVAALEFARAFRFGDDEDYTYRLFADEKTVYASEVLCGERFRHGTNWRLMVDTKFHFVDLAGNRPLGRPSAKRQGPLDTQETVTRIRLRLERKH